MNNSILFPTKVTDLQWSYKYGDLFAVTYGSYDFYKKTKKGFLCLFSLKNPSYPEYICKSGADILCCDTHPACPNMMVVGLSDGNVAVYNLVSTSQEACYSSSAATGKHGAPVWQVRHSHHIRCEATIAYNTEHPQVHWAKDNLDGYMNFYSCSGDGRVTNWTIVKTSLWFSDLLVVNFTKELQNFKNPVPMTDGVRTFAFKPDDDTVYLIGTEVMTVS